MRREMSSHARCAKEIRAELKEKFPDVKFSVRSESFSMGNAVDIEWQDGPSEEAVREVVGKYQYGHFDGMIDLYEYSNQRDDITQVKYVQVNRKISDKFYLQAAQLAHAHYADLENVKRPETEADLNENFMFGGMWYNWHQFAYRMLVKLDLTHAKGIREDPNFEGGCMWDGLEVY